ncbi:MAG: GNAT family N-acetyltransferase [Candidatus Beckwithbacteria bacterium]|nr:GNAT family N-acetyltransferase [Patescibacteria group bacterium]
MKEIPNYSVQIVSEPSKAWLDQAVGLINEYAEQGLMLVQKIEDLQQMAQAGWLVLALTEGEDSQVLGVAGLTAWTEVILEFGAWAVKEEYRDKGIGKELMAEAISTVPDDKWLVTFGNKKNSGPIFEKMGLKVLDQSKLPDELFEPCKDCHCDKSDMSEGQRCADTIFEVKGKL